MKIFLPILLTLITVFNLKAQVINTIAGNGNLGAAGDGTIATGAELYNPNDVCVDKLGNMFIADRYNHRIRKVDGISGIISTIAGSGIQGFSGDSGLAVNAQISNPMAIANDDSGNVFFVDYNNQRIRKICIATGVITTIAGNGTQGFSGDSSLAVNAQLYDPLGVCIDHNNNVYIGDATNNRIRKVDGTTGFIYTIVGNGAIGSAGDGGLSVNATLYNPTGVCVDDSNNVYIADTYNKKIRKINALTGIISSIAGDGNYGGTGDGGPATSAQLSFCFDVSVDAGNNIYIADSYIHSIRKVEYSSGKIYTIAGNGTQNFAGDGSFANASMLNFPYGIGTDSLGNVFIADTYNNRIRKISTCSPPSSSFAFTSNDSLCAGTIVSMSASDLDSGITYQWFKKSALDNGFFSFASGSNASIASEGGNTQFKLVVSKNLCADSSIQNFYTHNNPNINVDGREKYVCIGNTIELSPSTSDDSLWWSPGVNFVDSMYYPSTEQPSELLGVVGGTYYLHAVDKITGCAHLDSINLNLVAFPTINLTNDFTACAGTVYPINATVAGHDYFEWQTIDPNVNYGTAYDYNIILNDSLPQITYIAYASITLPGGMAAKGIPNNTNVKSNECVTRDTLMISIQNTPATTLSVLGSKSTCPGGTVAYVFGGATSYSWSITPDSINVDTAFFIVNNTTILTLTGYNASGFCSALVSDSLISRSPNVQYLNDTTICEGVMFSVYPYITNADSISWSSNDSLVNDSTFANFNVTADGSIPVLNYTLHTKSTLGCAPKDFSFTIQVDTIFSSMANPTFTFVNDTVCKGVTLNFSSDNQDSLNSYRWSYFGPWDEFSMPFDSVPISSYLPYAGGNFDIILKVSRGACSASITKSVLVNDKPSINAGYDMDVCYGSVAYLDMNSTADSLWWSPGINFTDSIYDSQFANAGQLNAIVSGFYTAHAYNSATGCSNTDSMYLTVHQLPVITTTPDFIACSGASYSIGATVTGADNWNWLSIDQTVNNGTDTGYTIVTNDSLTQITYIVNAIYYLPMQGRASVGIRGFGTCINKDTITVTIESIPNTVLSVISLKNVCAGETVSMAASGASSYSWNPTPDNLLIDTAQFIVNSNMPISLTGYTASGTCFSSAVDTLTAKITPSVNIGNDTLICTGASLNINANITDADSFVWSSNDSTINGTSNLNFTINPDGSVTPLSFVGYASNSNGCNAYKSYFVVVEQTPTVAISSPNDVCIGYTTLVIGSGAVNYSWSPTPNNGLSDTVQYEFYNSTSITLFGYSSGGNCSSSVNKSINVIDLPIMTAGTNLISCAPGNSVQLTGSIHASTINSNLWTSSDSNFVNVTDSITTVTPNATAEYVFTSTNSYGCINSDTMTVTIAPPNPISFIYTNDTTVCTGFPVSISVLANDLYTWTPSPDSVATSGSYFTAWFSPSTSSTYRVNGIDLNSCAVQDSAKINTLALPYVYGSVQYDSLGTLINLASGNASFYYADSTASNSKVFDGSGSITNGSFAYSLSHPGDFAIFSEPDSSIYYPNVFPTFQDGIVVWNEVTKFSLACGDTLYKTITHEYLAIGNDTGVGRISGEVRWISSIRKPGEPVKGVGVIIQRRPGGNNMRYTQTDSLGLFTFDNLPENLSYRILISLPGYNMVDVWADSITVGSPIDSGITYYVSADTIYLAIDTTDPLAIKNQIELKKKGFAIGLYPNPINERTTLTIQGKPSSQIVAEVLDLNGRKLKVLILKADINGYSQVTLSPTQLNLSSGTYLIRKTDTSEVIRFVIE